MTATDLDLYMEARTPVWMPVIRGEFPETVLSSGEQAILKYRNNELSVAGLAAVCDPDTTAEVIGEMLR